MISILPEIKVIDSSIFSIMKTSYDTNTKSVKTKGGTVRTYELNKYYTDLPDTHTIMAIPLYQYKMLHVYFKPYFRNGYFCDALQNAYCSSATSLRVDPKYVMYIVKDNSDDGNFVDMFISDDLTINTKTLKKKSSDIIIKGKKLEIRPYNYAHKVVVPVSSDLFVATSLYDAIYKEVEKEFLDLTYSTKHTARQLSGIGMLAGDFGMGMGASSPYTTNEMEDSINTLLLGDYRLPSSLLGTSSFAFINQDYFKTYIKGIKCTTIFCDAPIDLSVYDYIYIVRCTMTCRYSVIFTEGFVDLDFILKEGGYLK